MIVEYATVLSYCQKEHSAEIEQIHQSVEGWIKTRTGHDWEYDSDGYVEFCTRTSSQYLQLDHYPVYQVTEISPITSGIQIRNTSTDSRNAYVAVDSDSLDLTVIGGVNAMARTALAFSSYATLSALVTAINAQAHGWDAVIYDTDYNSYLSASLLEVDNFFCGSVRGETPGYQYLEMLDSPYSNYDINKEAGIVYRAGGWTSGYRRIVAKYTAYYTIPDEITGAVLDGVRFLLTQHDEGAEGVKSYRTGDYSVTYLDSVMPAHVLEAVTLHSKVI